MRMNTYVKRGVGVSALATRSSKPRTCSAAAQIAVLLLVSGAAYAAPATPVNPQQQLTRTQQKLLDRFVAAALERTHHIVRYDPAYVRIPYPDGDVPASTGVCTDEVIRAYRAVGIDLQKEVHEDMSNHLSAYPRRWSNHYRFRNTQTDPNIDHRRVPNLMVFFSR